MDWKQIWNARKLDPARSSQLSQLMAADGLDNPFSEVDENAWRAYVARIGERLGITPDSSVFEVGCGAGAFVLPHYEAGCRIGGLDASETLLGYARSAMPDAQLTLAEAAALDDTPWDFVLSMGVFLYFPSHDYAREVVTRMRQKARRGLAILDVADVAKKSEAIAMRRGHLDEKSYEERYRGLDHLYFDRDWFRAILPGAEIFDQDIPGYANAPFRFNVVLRF